MNLILYWWRFWLKVFTPKTKLRLVYTKRTQND